MKTKNVQELVRKGNLKEALLIAGKFKRTFSISKEDLDIIQTGYECLVRPEFYKQLYKDYEARINKAYEVLERVYGEKEMNEREAKIKNQLDKLMEYIPRTTIHPHEVTEILGLEDVEDKNIVLNLIEEYKKEGKISNNAFGIYIEG